METYSLYVSEVQYLTFGRSHLYITEPSPDAGEGVEEVRRRVAPVIQHLVK